MAPELLMSCGTLQELLIVALRKGVLTEVQALLTYLDLDYVPVDRVLALKGLELYQLYGKGGGHPARLNYGDCFAAAIATVRQVPLLYAGKDFQSAGF
jgi:ribonuclease VapC